MDLDEDYTFYKAHGPKHLDPLLNLEIYNSDFTFLTSRRASHTGVLNTGGMEKKNNQRNNVMENSRTIRGSNNSNNSTVVKTSKSAELLDKILSEEDVIVEVGEEQRERMSDITENGSHDPILIASTDKERDTSVSRDSGIGSISRSDSVGQMKNTQRSTKKHVHKRSMSDFGVPTKTPEPKPQPISVSPDSASLSGYNKTKDNVSAADSVRSGDTYFPRPAKGQSLMSFLSSQDFHTCAEMDKVSFKKRMSNSFVYHRVF